MAKRTGTLSVDKTEIILIDMHGKEVVQRNIFQDQVASIVLERTTVKKFFKKTETERITIHVRKLHPSPYLLQNEVGENWACYKRDLMIYAKENRIAFENNLNIPES